jgi:hypothetical protein
MGEHKCAVSYSTIRNKALKLADALGWKVLDKPGLMDYALVAEVTDTPLDRAIVYLKDTGSPQHALGRLLLRAAERALREAGDVA